MNTHLFFKKSILLHVLFSATFLSSCATDPNASGAGSPKLVWARPIGGSGDDVAMAITHTSDGGSAIVGATGSTDGDLPGMISGIPDLCIIKLDRDGTIQWQKKLGGNREDIGTAIRETSDHGFIVTGSTTSRDGDLIAQNHHGHEDYWIMKMDDTGRTIWRTTHGGSQGDIPACVTETFDGSYVIAGATNSKDLDVTVNNGGEDIWVIKLNHNGVFVWEKSYGGSGNEEPHSIEETSDHGFIIAGTSLSNDSDVVGHHGDPSMPDYWILKIGSGGELQWAKSLGGTGFESAAGALQTPDGGYFVVGTSLSVDGDVTTHIGDPLVPNCWILKLNSGGTIQWQKSIANGAIPVCLRPSSNGGYLVGGTTVMGHGGTDIWAAKLSANGDLQWQNAIGGSKNELGRGIDECPDGSVVVTGYTESNDGDALGSHGNLEILVAKLKH